MASRELVLWLLEQGQQPRHLGPGLSDAESLLTAGLEEVIRLREQGQPQLSLALVEQLERAGLASPWLDDNRARALVALERNREAVPLWWALSGHGDPTVASLAREALERQEPQLLEGLHHHCSFHGWEPQHLPPRGASSNGGLLQLALQEAITSREANRAGLSLALMEEALHQGWQSPWVLDNRARALVNLDRRREAQEIWEQLRQSPDAAAAALAAEALGQLAQEAWRLEQRQRAEQLLAAGERQAAQDVVLELLAFDPDDGALLELLDRSLEAQKGSSDDLLSQELAPVNRTLERHGLLLSQLEQQLQR